MAPTSAERHCWNTFGTLGSTPNLNYRQGTVFTDLRVSYESI
jgi:hypothetical protein